MHPLLLLLICLCFPTLSWAEETVQIRPYQRQVTFTGFTRAKQQITISSEVSGRCLAIYGDRGDTIPDSGKLAAIDTTFIDLDLETNRLTRKKVARQLASERKTLKRYTTLHNRKSVPQATLDEVSLNSELHELSLKDLENEAARLQQRLERYTITAPPGWQVIERLTEPGEYIQAGQPVARLGNFQELLVPLALSFSELQALQQATAISLLLPDLNHRVPARLYRTSPAFDPISKKISVDLLLAARQEHLDQQLRGGMRAELQLQLRERTNIFVLPLSALISRYDAHWLVTPQQERVKVIFLGTCEEETLAIVSGENLSTKDRFLTHPSQRPQP